MNHSPNKPKDKDSDSEANTKGWKVGIPNDYTENNEATPLDEISAIYLFTGQYGWDLWEFEYVEKHKIYVLKSLFYDGIRNKLSEWNIMKRYPSEKSSVTIQDNSGIIDELSNTEIKDFIRKYLDSLPPQISVNIREAAFSVNCESFSNVMLRQIHNLINDTWLENLKIHDKPLLKDDANTGYFTFKNCIVRVTKDEIKIEDLEGLEGFCQWKARQIQKEFEYVSHYTEGQFYKFCVNVTAGIDGRFESLCTAIGQLLHNHRSATKNHAIILYDEAFTTSDKPEGGTGKGLIANAIKEMRDTVKIDGKQYDSSDRFKFQNVSPSTQVVWIDETNSDFDMKDLFSCLTDGWVVERKYKKKFFIERENSPNVLICSNEVLPHEGGSYERRQHIIELNDYYSSKRKPGKPDPVEAEHGILFSPEKWTQTDWNRFYSFMLKCLMQYLSTGLKPYENKNVKLNYLRKQITMPEFFEWIDTNPFQFNVDFEIKPLFEDFRNTYLGDDSKLKQRTFTSFIKAYASAIDGQLQQRKSSGVTYYNLKK
jgi:hypothetical protein